MCSSLLTKREDAIGKLHRQWKVRENFFLVFRYTITYGDNFRPMLGKIVEANLSSSAVIVSTTEHSPLTQYLTERAFRGAVLVW